MTSRLTAALWVLILAGMSSYAAAQGRGHSAGGAPGGGARGPMTSSPLPSQRQDAQHRIESQQRRAAGEAHNRSTEARAQHPPDEHAADEARLAEKNSANKDRREERRALREKNRRSHGNN